MLLKTVKLYKLMLFSLLVVTTLTIAGPRNTEIRLQAADSMFLLEIASSPEEKRTGLMYRRFLPPSHGLLMVFQADALVPIWMKNVFIPLDVVWLAADGRVVDKQTLPLCRQSPCPIYRPALPARYVLEVGAGLFPLNRGDKVEIIDSSGDSLLPFAPAT